MCLTSAPVASFSTGNTEDKAVLKTWTSSISYCNFEELCAHSIIFYNSSCSVCGWSNVFPFSLWSVYIQMLSGLWPTKILMGWQPDMLSEWPENTK